MLISYEELKSYIGGQSRAEVAARLKRMGVRYLLRPDGRPITTLDAFNAAMRLRPRRADQVPNPEDDKPTIEVG